MEPEARSYGTRIVGWGLLLLALPLAFMAATHSPNEYKATLDIAAPDCGGPEETFGLCVISFFIYGVGFVSNALRWQSRWNLAVAATCLLICVAVGVNYHRAMLEEDAQRMECSLHDMSAIGLSVDAA